MRSPRNMPRNRAIWINMVQSQAKYNLICNLPKCVVKYFQNCGWIWLNIIFHDLNIKFNKNNMLNTWLIMLNPPAIRPSLTWRIRPAGLQVIQSMSYWWFRYLARLDAGGVLFGMVGWLDTRSILPNKQNIESGKSVGSYSDIIIWHFL